MSSLKRKVIKPGVRGVRGKSKYILECNECGEEFYLDGGYFRYNDRSGLFCSHSCQFKFSSKNREPWNKNLKGYMSGKDSPSWKGGKFYTKAGYKYILNKSHPNATKMGYVLEHRLVAEKNLGRLLSENEIVHHKNGVKDDNRIENLEVITQSNHVRKHFGIGNSWAKEHDSCVNCGTTSEPHYCKGRCKPCYRKHYYQTHGK